MGAGPLPSAEEPLCTACAGRVQALLPARVLPECEGRRGRACLAASACLVLLLLVGALTAPWWATWLLWRPSRTSFVTLPAGMDALPRGPLLHLNSSLSAWGHLALFKLKSLVACLVQVSILTPTLSPT